MLKLLQRHGSPNWYIRGTVRGQSIDESTGTSIKQAAEEIRARKEHDLLEQSIHGRRVSMTFSQAALSYLELQGDTRFMKPLLLHFGSRLLSTIDQDAMDAAAKKLYAGCAPSTINRQLYTPVSAVLHHAAKRKWCSAPAFDRPRQPEGRVRWLTKDEAELLLRACAPHLRPLVMFLLYTGARVGEALWLEWKDVDLQRRHVQFTDTKNRLHRGVPLHPLLVSELLNERSKRTCTSAVVFVTHRGQAYEPIDDALAGETSAGSRIKTGFHSAVKRAGLRDVRPHDLRHTWATWHYQVNRDLGALQKLGGWKTLSMVMRYAHTNVDELSSTIDRM